LGNSGTLVLEKAVRLDPAAHRRLLHQPIAARAWVLDAA
jgi:hypothetical protein